MDDNEAMLKTVMLNALRAYREHKDYQEDRRPIIDELIRRIQEDSYLNLPPLLADNPGDRVWIAATSEWKRREGDRLVPANPPAPDLAAFIERLGLEEEDRLEIVTDGEPGAYYLSLTLGDRNFMAAGTLAACLAQLCAESGRGEGT